MHNESSWSEGPGLCDLEQKCPSLGCPGPAIPCLAGPALSGPLAHVSLETTSCLPCGGSDRSGLGTQPPPRQGGGTSGPGTSLCLVSSVRVTPSARRSLHVPHHSSHHLHPFTAWSQARLCNQTVTSEPGLGLSALIGARALCRVPSSRGRACVAHSTLSANLGARPPSRSPQKPRCALRSSQSASLHPPF